MKKLYFLILLLISSFSSSLIAQKTIEYKDEIINQLDENNKQTGLWKLYDDEKNILITCSFKDGNYASNTNYYKDSKLIASYDNFDIIEIYKKGKTIKASFFKRPDNATTLVDDKGKELDTSIIKYFFQSGQALPIYYGGMSKFYEYIRGKTNFRNKEKGRVVVKFYINEKGETSNAEIVESDNVNLDEIAKQIVSDSPRWQPAHQRGIFVKCSYSIPIVFN